MSGKFDLGDYIEVRDRIRLYYEAYPEGSIVTTKIWSMTLAGEEYICVKAKAYRTPDDPRPTSGSSWIKMPGSTSYTKTAELENAETSAWGRAIGARGIGIKGSIASANEVRAKSEVPADVGRSDDGGLIGNVEKGERNTSDFELHVSPDGHNLGFRLRGDKGGILVRTVDPLASQLFDHRYEVIGKRVTAWGKVIDVPPAGKARGYQALEADRVSVPGIGMLPEPMKVASVDETPVITEAESEAIWAEVERLGA